MRSLVLLPLLALAACATGSDRFPPTEVLRYHLPGPLDRGSATVEPATSGFGSQLFEAAVARQLERAGYPGAAAAAPTPFIAVVDVRRRDVEGPPRRSGLTIGIGGGTFSGGRRGGFGLGGGAAFPVGGTRGSAWLETELNVLIKRRGDQTTVWEGHARGIGRRDADPTVEADRLANALFTGFPGESGRTISVP